MHSSSVYRFARRVSRLVDSASAYQFIVDAIAREIGAEAATLAVKDDRECVLRIVATHGYPAILVEDVRIPPGAGIIGGAFTSRRARLVAAPAGAAARLRYRTPSFLEVPLLVGREALGVIMLADPRGADRFGRAQLMTARAIGAVAALAIARVRANAYAQEMARTAGVDALTGLFNRRHFEHRLQEEVQRAHRYGSHMALLLIDVDDLKAINDGQGHIAGDALLREVAAILRRAVRVFDTCARYGGDEFAILMPATTLDNAMVTAERIRSRVERQPIVIEPRTVLRRVTVTIGVSPQPRDSATSAWLASADRALYVAKLTGKNRVQLATP